jgi:hypothetical protein
VAQALERRGSVKLARRDLLQEPTQTVLRHRKRSWVIANVFGSSQMFLGHRKRC